MNRRLLPVFQAAKPTITRMTTKMTPPVVTSSGKPLAAISANAERLSGGTTSAVIKRMKINDATAPTVVSSGTPICLENNVSSAVASPAKTSSVPKKNRIQRPSEEGCVPRDEGGGRRDESRGKSTSSLIPPPSSL